LFLTPNEFSISMFIYVWSNSKALTSQEARRGFILGQGAGWGGVFDERGGVLCVSVGRSLGELGHGTASAAALPDVWSGHHRGLFATRYTLV